MMTEPIVANIVWPSLYLVNRLLGVFATGTGLIVEFFFVRAAIRSGMARAASATFLMNLISTLLGFILVPAVGLVVAIFPGVLFGTFSYFTWGAIFIAVVAVNTFIEISVLRKWVGLDYGTREFWLIWFANTLSVGCAFASFLIFPIRG